MIAYRKHLHSRDLVNNCKKNVITMDFVLLTSQDSLQIEIWYVLNDLWLLQFNTRSYL